MRAIAISVCLSCAGAVAPPAEHPVPTRARVDTDRAPVDPIAALTPDDSGEVSWVIPGPILLELGGTALAAGGPGHPIEVGAIDQEGSLARVAVRLEHARFSVWIDRAHLLSLLRRDQRIDPIGAPIGGDIGAVLHTGATVRRLAHRERSTQVRYLGALEVEGWVPDDALTDRGRGRDPIGRIPTGRKTLMVTPGAKIRAEPRWGASEIAVMATGYFLDTLREVDDEWVEVSYIDGDIAVHGFVSRRAPPGRVHHWQETDATPTVTPSATVASGTCLYARPGGDAIGYIVGNRPVDLDEGAAGWWMITIDTPWGPLVFAARGPTAAELVACAPPNTVPPAIPLPAPVP